MAAEILLALATLAVAYIIIGYPLVLFACKGRVAPPVRKDMGYQTTVTVIVAVYNGEQFMRAKLESILSLHYPQNLLQILVVSDGSTDGTDVIVESFADRNVQLIRAPHGGKAAALNAALRSVRGEILFFTDVRQALHPDALSQLVANFADPSVGAVTGELQFLDPAHAGQQADLELYWRYELWARRRHSQIDSILVTTGCIYAIRRTVAEPIPPDTLTDDAVIPLRIQFRGYRVIFEEQAIAYDYPTAEGGEFRRRLRTLAGLWQVHVRLPAIFSRANRMRFHFLSHKSARLALPWAILLIWIATIALPASSYRTFLLVDEVALVAVALLDRYIPKWFPLKRISSPARTFLTMNAAAFLALAVFFVPPETLWRPTRVKVRHERRSG
jgi:cellulose synthase/poly-beta-1,6-N-acetylglucosamine synthase-like glycosyltransferase